MFLHLCVSLALFVPFACLFCHLVLFVFVLSFTIIVFNFLHLCLYVNEREKERVWIRVGEEVGEDLRRVGGGEP